MSPDQHHEAEKRYNQDKSPTEEPSPLGPSLSLTRANMNSDRDTQVGLETMLHNRDTADGIPTLNLEKPPSRLPGYLVVAPALVAIVVIVFLIFIVIIPRIGHPSSTQGKHPTPPQSIGIYRYDPNQTVPIFYLKNSFTGGVADETVAYGNSRDNPLVGDWTGSGDSSIGVYDPTTSTFYLATSDHPDATATYFFQFGIPGKIYIPIAGDWTGHGKDGVGLYDPVTSTFYLRNTLSGGAADTSFQFGDIHKHYLPIAGDWDGTGKDSVGLYDPATGMFSLTNTLPAPGAAPVTDESFHFGAINALPIAGDWHGTGRDSIGIYNPQNATFYIKYTLSSGDADDAVSFGGTGGNVIPLVGHWKP